jgi:hypothetical protein
VHFVGFFFDESKFKDNFVKKMNDMKKSIHQLKGEDIIAQIDGARSTGKDIILMVSVKPFKLSVTVMNMSSTPRAFMSVKTPSQNEELSDLPAHMPKTSFIFRCYESFPEEVNLKYITAAELYLENILYLRTTNGFYNVS